MNQTRGPLVYKADATGNVVLLFVVLFLGYNQYWPDGFLVFMSRSTRPVSTINRATIGTLEKRHPNGVSLLWWADSGSRLDDGWAKAQPAVVLILKRLRKRGHGFKSHLTAWDKPGIKPRGPGYATGELILLFVAVFPGYNQNWLGGFMVFLLFYVQEHPKAQRQWFWN